MQEGMGTQTRMPWMVKQIAKQMLASLDPNDRKRKA